LNQSHAASKSFISRHTLYFNETILNDDSHCSESDTCLDHMLQCI